VSQRQFLHAQLCLRFKSVLDIVTMVAALFHPKLIGTLRNELIVCRSTGHDFLTRVLIAQTPSSCGTCSLGCPFEKVFGKPFPSANRVEPFVWQTQKRMAAGSHSNLRLL